MEKTEDSHTPGFLVEVKASKQQMKQAGKKLHDADVAEVNTLIRPGGQKEACV